MTTCQREFDLANPPEQYECSREERENLQTEIEKIQDALDKLRQHEQLASWHEKRMERMQDALDDLALAVHEL